MIAIGASTQDLLNRGVEPESKKYGQKMLKSTLGLMLLPDPHAGGPHPRSEADFPKKKERDAWIIIYAFTAGKTAMSLKTARQHRNDNLETLYAIWTQSPKKTKAKTTTR